MYELLIIILSVIGTVAIFSLMTTTVSKVVAPTVQSEIKPAWEYYSSLHFRDFNIKRIEYYRLLIDLMNAQHHRSTASDCKITGRVLCRILLDRLEEIYTRHQGQFYIDQPLRSPFVRYHIEEDQLIQTEQDEFELLTNARNVYEAKGPKRIATIPETLTVENGWEHTYQVPFVYATNTTDVDLSDLVTRQKAEAWERLTGKIV